MEKCVDNLSSRAMTPPHGNVKNVFSENDVIEIEDDSVLGDAVKVVRMGAMQRRLFPMPDIRIENPLLRKGRIHASPTIRFACQGLD